MILPRRFLRSCRRAMRRSKVADTSGVNLTGGRLLTATLVLRRLLRRGVLAADERHVGLLLPPSAGGVLANAALAVDGRVAINLNYTLSSEVLNDCIHQAGIRHVLTSRRVLERFPNLQLEAELVFLEELRTRATWRDKLAGAVAAWAVPVRILERWLGLTRIAESDLMTIIFTSGSTGRPKGVMLSQGNLASNMVAFQEVLDFSARDVLLGVLPFFHSFGYTTALWTALTLDVKVAYHVSPLEAQPIGALCREHGVNCILSAPTFLRTYLRRCAAEDFWRLEAIITGSERLPPELADAFAARFGVRPVEGYGTTELSPVVSTNIPPGRGHVGYRGAYKPGTVGRPLPNIRVKVVHPETGAELPANQPGMLLVQGPNVMQGYLNQPQLTAEVLRDGWYTTGDIAAVDEEGYIRITGRQSRFSKIGGEMVPHMHVEETLARIFALDGDDQLRVAVTGIADARKGERLIVLHTGLGVPPQEACRRLADTGLPPLWIPAADSFYQIESIPVVATGKLDLKRLADLALELSQRPLLTP